MQQHIVSTDLILAAEDVWYDGHLELVAGVVVSSVHANGFLSGYGEYQFLDAQYEIIQMCAVGTEIISYAATSCLKWKHCDIIVDVM
eukprot:4766341-Amphidinium_carterae.1